MTDYKEVEIINERGEKCLATAPHKANKEDGVPIGFGRWSDVPIGENWVKVTDSFVDGNDYPILYALLLDILAGTRNISYISVYTSDDAIAMELEDDTYKIEKNSEKLAKSYIIDTVNNSFRFPKYILSNYSVGNPDTMVISNENGFGGKTMISASGHYFQFGNLIRLERATYTEEKEVEGGETEEVTYEYYKPTAWYNPDLDIEIGHREITEKMSTKIIYTEDLVIDLDYPQLYPNIYIQFYICPLLSEGTTEKEVNSEIITIPLEEYGTNTIPANILDYNIESDKTSITVSFAMYDENNYDTEKQKERLQNYIPNNVNKCLISYIVEGYTTPPNIENYNANNYNLYIKVV